MGLETFDYMAFLRTLDVMYFVELVMATIQEPMEVKIAIVDSINP